MLLFIFTHFRPAIIHLRIKVRLSSFIDLVTAALPCCLGSLGKQFHRRKGRTATEGTPRRGISNGSDRKHELKKLGSGERTSSPGFLAG
eukprot:scaffold3460_cov93-Skeletonema_dohrnii-CCMP3373.AAC.2